MTITGELHLITGPMFSGKTSALVKTRSDMIGHGMPCVCFHHARDDRYGDKGRIVTHDGQKLVSNPITDFEDILQHPSFDRASCIFVDEVQFFRDIAPCVIRMVETHNKRVYLAGLVVDANRNPFGELHTLLGLANTVDVRTAKRCALCDNPGLFSTALFAIDPNSTVDRVGHSDKYTNANMDTGEPQEKKKRGRKPKSEKGGKTSDKSSTKGTESMDQHILHLNITQRKHLENSSSTDKLYEKDFCTYDPEMKVPNAYNEFDTFISQPYELVMNNENPNTEKKNHNVKVILQNIDKQTYTNVACYWCCHKFDHEYLGMPVKYKDNVFEIYGCFCSFECMCAYNFYSNESNHNTWEVYNLINIMANKMDYGSVVYPAPPRKCLTFFGGYMSIDEFRKFRNANKIINANKCPMVVMVDQIEEINDYYHNQHKHIKHMGLKLDKARIESFEKKLNVQLEDNIKKNFKNTLDATMMINS